MKDHNDLPFEIEARMQLLRRQLGSEREKYAQCVFRLDDAEKIIERFLQLNFPVLHGQCKAAGIDLIDEATRILRGLRTGGDMERVVALMQRDGDLQLAPTSPSPAEADADRAPVTISDDLGAESIAALQVLGETADFDVATLRWARQIQLPAVPALAADNLGRLEELREKFRELLAGTLAPYVELVYVPAGSSGQAYQAAHLVYLTEERGVPDYEARFGKPPVRKPRAGEAGADAVELPDEGTEGCRAFLNPATYPTAECWWWTRATKTLIELGNRLPDNPFHATVYDPACDTLPADFLTRYPPDARPGQGSAPNLIVVLEPRIGGKPVHIALTVEYANRSNPVLRSMLVNHLRDYHPHFDGIYYLAPNRAAARRLKTALKALHADSQPQGDRPPFIRTLAPGLLAVFQGAALEGKWLPSPSQVDRWSPTPPETKPNMAPAFHYYKHKVRPPTES